MNTKKLLLVEDNQEVLRVNAEVFASAGYAVQTAETLAAARESLRACAPDLVVLDIQMPDGSGLDLCKELRGPHSPLPSVPILFLTVLSESSHVVEGLRSGGDEYMVKPYAADELVARVQALLRRVEMERRNAAGPRTFGAIAIDPATQRAYVDGKDALLKQREYLLLMHLIDHAGQAFTAEKLYAAVWGAHANGDTRTVRSHIYCLRQKLHMDEGGPLFIETVGRKAYVCRMR